MQKNLLIATFVTLGLSACTSIGSLQSTQADARISGTVTRGFLEPYRVEINLDGKTYRGEWRTGAPTAEQKATTTRPHRKHVGEVRSVLLADDGSKLDCRWLTHSETGEGSCSADNREYPLTLK